jgi:hypothetical protein
LVCRCLVRSSPVNPDSKFPHQRIRSRREVFLRTLRTVISSRMFGTWWFAPPAVVATLRYFLTTHSFLSTFLRSFRASHRGDSSINLASLGRSVQKLPRSAVLLRQTLLEGGANLNISRGKKRFHSNTLKVDIGRSLTHFDPKRQSKYSSRMEG